MARVIIDQAGFDKLDKKKYKEFVFYQVGDKFYVRSRPEKSKGPATEAQLKSRSRFAEMARAKRHKD